MITNKLITIEDCNCFVNVTNQLYDKNELTIKIDCQLTSNQNDQHCQR